MVRQITAMKAYLITTAIIFALVTVAHIVRIFAEGPRLAKEPVFMLLTVLTAALTGWACRLLKTAPRS